MIALVILSSGWLGRFLSKLSNSFLIKLIPLLGRT